MNGGINRLIQYGNNRLGRNAQIFDPVTLGFPSREYLGTKDFPGVTIGTMQSSVRAASFTAR